jgi:hypothetical protein
MDAYYAAIVVVVVVVVRTSLSRCRTNFFPIQLLQT